MHIPDGVAALEHDLRGIFGTRLQSLVVYGLKTASTRSTHDDDTQRQAHGHGAPPLTNTLAIVDRLSPEDLRACTARIAAWHEQQLATPLLVAAHEFERSLDAFPFEFGSILADHQVVAGPNPFETMSVDAADLRRACEVQARGHLLHLRQGFLETRGRSDALALLVVRSAPACAALFTSVVRLDGDGAGDDVAAAARAVERRLQLPAPTASAIVALLDVAEISSSDAERLFPPYLDAIERLVAYIDGWS